jgi:hypothetical protein
VGVGPVRLAALLNKQASEDRLSEDCQDSESYEPDISRRDTRLLCPCAGMSLRWPGSEMAVGAQFPRVRHVIEHGG